MVKLRFSEKATKLVMSKLKGSTLPTAEILSGKNAQAWVSMVLYLRI